MNGTLKVTTTIYCDTCCQPLKRTRSIRVEASEKKEAILEASKKIDTWKETLKGQNCKTCKSIIAAVTT